MREQHPRYAPLFALAAFALGALACDETENAPVVDAGAVPTPDAGSPSGNGADAGPIRNDAGEQFGAAPKIVPLSTSGHDRLFGVVVDSAGSIFATGAVATGTTSTDDFSMVVAKFTPGGALDRTFGTEGVASHNVVVGTGGELARGIVVQSTGKVVIAGTVEHEGATDPRDRDVALVRFDADGSLDRTFGVDGVSILDLSTGEVAGMGYAADTAWGLNVLPDDALIVTGARKADGRTDLDFAVAKVDADGALDPQFGTNGVFSLDLDNQGASPKMTVVLADGSLVVSGYVNIAGVVSPVIFKLTPAGALDTNFGVGGVYTEVVLGSVAEAYALAAQGDHFVTSGYGRNDTTESLDFLSIRITPAGTRDTTYGTNGVARLDVAGFNDNARSLVVFPDNRVLLVGGGRPTMDNVDAMVALLTPNGALDTTFSSTGYTLFDLGGASDFFWGVALTPDRRSAVLVGTKGAAPGTGEDDDGALFILPQPVSE